MIGRYCAVGITVSPSFDLESQKANAHEKYDLKGGEEDPLKLSMVTQVSE